MKRALLFMGLILMIFCSSGDCTIASFYSTNKLNATLSGGSDMKSVNGLIQEPSYHANQLNVAYGAGLAVVDVKDISMNSTAFLVVTDSDGRKYPTVLTAANTLHLPSESNVVMRNGCDINIDSSDPGAPKTNWKSTLEFPDDLDLAAVNLNSSLENIPLQDLEALSNYCTDHGIGYITENNAYFTDTNSDVGVTCRWGEGERIVVGTGNAGSE
ncbi:MAG: hypothetical protein ACE14P_03105 [Methanotrichaceae archaeon]